MITTNNQQYLSKKIITLSALSEKIELFRIQRKKIGLCTGSFDLLHPGHIIHLQSAKKQCNILIIAIATDEFNTRTRNTPGRPIFSQEIRAFAASQLKTVDFVTISEDTTEVIRTVKPDIYIKGQDYKNGHDPILKEQERLLNSLGGILIFTEDEKLSTTSIIDYIQKLPPI